MKASDALNSRYDLPNAQYRYVCQECGYVIPDEADNKWSVQIRMGKHAYEHGYFEREKFGEIKL